MMTMNKSSVDEVFTIHITPSSEEYLVWKEHLSPVLSELPKNILEICQYGFTEIFNNVIDHSGSKDAFVHLKCTDVKIEISVIDIGIGIFKHIQNELNLDDERESLFEPNNPFKRFLASIPLGKKLGLLKHMSLSI